MSKTSVLPTCTSAEWTVADFLCSLSSELAEQKDAGLLRLYFYAVTIGGWNQIEPIIINWLKDGQGRFVEAYIGTDHAITDISSLEAMQKAGVTVNMLKEYSGVYHPKVAWLATSTEHIVWAGSNNLTRDGLSNNIEFALMIKSHTAPTHLGQWHSVVASSSAKLSEDLLSSYSSEREKFRTSRGRAKTETFVWTKRLSTSMPAAFPKGNLVVEVMPLETGTDGTQIQIPKGSSTQYFGLGKTIGASKTIVLKSKRTGETKHLSMTMYSNQTTRLSISELDYRDRPCLVIFTKKNKHYEYDIISKSTAPSLYMALLKQCLNQTRSGSRRWGITK